jgi:AraC family transcriptional regulator
VSGLNKPAAPDARFQWQPRSTPRWYLWDGGFLLIGEGGGEVPAHAHHAIQVFISIDGKATIRAAGTDWKEGRGMIVRPDVEHGFNAQGRSGAMMFVDAESSEGLWLRALLTQDVTVVPDARLEACVGELRTFWENPLAALDAGELVRHCVRALCAGTPPSRTLDPRVTKVLRAIADSEDLRLSLEDAAELAHLSPDRFAHVFKDQLGLPFRRYMLWRKVTRAMVAIGRERTIADAAHASAFADAAHLTRTFNEMFGMPPSVLMRGEFFEIPSPFAQAA